MTQDAIDFVLWFGENIWLFFTSWKIPGTGTTPAGWILFCFIVLFVWKVVKHIMHSDWMGGN